MRQFAEQEIIHPTGPYMGRRFRVERNPFAGLLLEAMSGNLWSRHFGTGPQQSGKTFILFVIPILYHLFEIKERVIVGLPMEDMAIDKWNDDLLPVIEKTQYRDLLPKTGMGSRGGKVTRIQFQHGPTLRFMTAGGNDKKRAGATSRVLVLSEVDGFDESGGTSREADKVSQLEGRTRAFGDRAKIYGECTVSIETGRTWREVKGGTDSRILIRCPKCQAYVTPEREHLVGWQDAEDVLTAGDKTRIACPSCGEVWEEADRIRANHDCKLIHKGQELTPDGKITGKAMRTNTLGFRWNAANNLLVSQRVIGSDEWAAARDPDEDNAEKKQRQFVWAIPSKQSTVDLTTFDATAITSRMGTEPRAKVPAWCRQLTIGIDIGKWLCHWTAMGWGENATPHVVEYGRLDVASAEMAEETAILYALRSFRDSVCKTGWATYGEPMKPALMFVDCGYHRDLIRGFAKESSGVCAVQGFSRVEDRARKQGGKIVGRGQDCVVVEFDDGLPAVIEAGANAWKSFLHARLQTPIGQPGAMTLYNAGKPVEHLSFAKHLTAEKKREEFVSGKGLETWWEVVNRNNHWLDASCLACVAGWWAGARLIGTLPDPPRPADKPKQEPEWIKNRPEKWL